VLLPLSVNASYMSNWDVDSDNVIVEVFSGTRNLPSLGNKAMKTKKKKKLAFCIQIQLGGKVFVAALLRFVSVLLVKFQFHESFFGVGLEKRATGSFMKRS